MDTIRSDLILKQLVHLAVSLLQEVSS